MKRRACFVVFFVRSFLFGAYFFIQGDRKMKNKKCLLCLTLIVVLAFTSFFAACDKRGDGKPLEGSMTIVILAEDETQTKAVEVDLSKFTDSDRLNDVIDVLAAEQKLCYKGSNGIYGMYYTAMGIPVEAEYNGETYMTDSYIIEENASAGKYVYLFTSVESDQLKVTEGYTAQSVEYEGQKLVEAAKGASFLELTDGAVVCFSLIVYAG